MLMETATANGEGQNLNTTESRQGLDNLTDYR